MEIPDIVTQRLGDEDVIATVTLGDEDVACFTPTRTLIYRGEGLLSDESVDVYDHDVEQLVVSEGRRKAKFTLEYVDRTEKFAVRSSHTERILEHLIDGILGVAGILDDEESVSGVYRFSELTLIITDKRLVRHIGNAVWDDDYEEYSFDDVTGLSFEEGSVATQIVLSVAGRPQRIKAPNDEVPLLQRTLTETLCAYHDVQSLGELNASVGIEPTAEGNAVSATESGLELDEGIAPLVGDADEPREGDRDPLATPDTDGHEKQQTDANANATAEAQTTETATTAESDTTAASKRSTPESETQTLDENRLRTVEQQDAREPAVSKSTTATTESATTDDSPPQPAIDPTEFEQLKEQVETLTVAVQRQNDLLRQQHETIQRLLNQRK